MASPATRRAAQHPGLLPHGQRAVNTSAANASGRPSPIGTLLRNTPWAFNADLRVVCLTDR
jgi:hypothetical protein